MLNYNKICYNLSRNTSISSMHSLDYLQNSMSNPVIQTLLLVLHRRLPKSCDKMCKKLLNLCFEETDDAKRYVC